MKSFLSLIILSLSVLALQAQPINKSSTNQLLSFGSELYDSGDYINAIEKLKEYVKEERDDLDAQYMIADASYKIKDYKYASKRYALLIKKDKDQGTYNKDLYNYANSLKQLGEYEEAIPVYEKYIEFTEDKRLKELAEIELAGALEAVDMLETLGLTVQRLESSDINSKQSEYSPTYYKDGETVYFASFAENKLIVLDGTEDEDYHLKIYRSDEETPFYKDGNLYFSTNGLPGMGGSDIYYTTWNGTRWSKPINMGKGYNSPLDDLFFSLSPDGYSGFLTSNRPGTSSVESSTCCNDIYEVLLTKVEASLITGAFTEDKKPIDSTDFQLVEMTNNRPGNSDLKNSDKTNKVTYALSLDKAYMVIANKEGYFPDTVEFNTVNLDETKEFAKVLYLKKKPEPVKPKEPDYETITINEAIELKNILYDFDDDKILPDAEQDLIVLRDLMLQYPDMKIQLNSHTDAQGKDKYNQELSQRRAASAKRWLIKNGVEVTRIKAVGKGEKEIRNECVNGVKCDDDEHRYNRRTEFVIIDGPTTIQVKKRQFIKKN